MLLSDDLQEVKTYDTKHGGAFYAGVGYSSTYSALRTMENRQLVNRHIARNGLIQWTISDRGHKALDWLERNFL